MTEPKKHLSECMIIKLENQPSQVSEEGRHFGRVITAEPKIDEGPKFFLNPKSIRSRILL